MIYKSVFDLAFYSLFYLISKSLIFTQYASATNLLAFLQIFQELSCFRVFLLSFLSAWMVLLQKFAWFFPTLTSLRPLFKSQFFRKPSLFTLSEMTFPLFSVAYPAFFLIASITFWHTHYILICLSFLFSTRMYVLCS